MLIQLRSVLNIVVDRLHGNCDKMLYVDIKHYYMCDKNTICINLKLHGNSALHTLYSYLYIPTYIM